MDLIQTLIDDDITNDPGPVTNLKHRPLSKSMPPTNTMIATYTNGCVKCWNWNYGQCMYTIKEKRQTYGIAYHPRLTKFVTCGDDFKINMYDEETKIQEHVFSGSNSPGILDGHTSRVFAVCFNPRSNYELVSGGWDNIIQFWDARQQFAVRHISGVHVCGDGIDICPTGSQLFTCAWQEENAMQVWDYGSGRLIQTIEPDIFHSKMYCCKYISKDYVVCGGAEPNVIRLLDMKHYGLLASVNKLPGAIYALDIGSMKIMRTQFDPNLPRKSIKRPKKIPTEQTIVLPKVVLTSAKRIYQIDFQ